MMNSNTLTASLILLDDWFVNQFIKMFNRSLKLIDNRALHSFFQFIKDDNYGKLHFQFKLKMTIMVNFIFSKLHFQFQLLYYFVDDFGLVEFWSS
jgi:hypothetical protein